MPLSFFRDTAIIVRAAVHRKNGAEVFDWDNATQTVLNGIQVAPQSTSRDFGERVLQHMERYTLRANYDADIQAGDRIVWNGGTYEIDGEVFHTLSPTGRVSSTRCALVRWSG